MCDRNTNRLIPVGIVNPATNDKWHQRNIVYSNQGISPSQTATQYKDAIRVLVEVDDEEKQ